MILNAPDQPTGSFAELRRTRDIYLDGTATRIGTIIGCLKPEPNRNATCQMTFVSDGVEYQVDFDRARVAQWRQLRHKVIAFMDDHRIAG